MITTKAIIHAPPNSETPEPLNPWKDKGKQTDIRSTVPTLTAPNIIALRQSKTGNTVGVMGYIEDIPCNLIIDTGATHSVLHGRILQRMQPFPLIEPSYTYLRDVTGDTSQVQGMVKLRVQINHFSATHLFYVSDIFDDCIIGMDFLTRHKCSINLGEHSLSIGQEVVPILEDGPISVRTISDYTIPAESTRFVLLYNPSLGDHCTVLLSPKDVPQDIWLPSAIYSSQSGRVLVRVTNLCKKPVELQTDTLLANASKYADIIV